MNLQEYADRLRRNETQINDRMVEAMRNATMRAIEKAQEMTPPNGDVRGANTRTGDLKAHWETDSQKEPQQRGNNLVTILANNMQYASYVNDGHRMDRHFVPGLVINAAGILDYNPGGEGGIVVGTKTTYVPGLHMTDEAKKVFERVLESELRRLGELIE